MPLIQVYFESTLTDRLGAFTFDILKAARENNRRNGITGLLLFNGPSIEEILEGEEDVVLARFEKFCHDDRHEVSSACEQPIQARMFSKWSAGTFRSFREQRRSACGGLLDAYFLDGQDPMTAHPALQRSVEERLLAYRA